MLMRRYHRLSPSSPRLQTQPHLTYHAHPIKHPMVPKPPGSETGLRSTDQVTRRRRPIRQFQEQVPSQPVRDIQAAQNSCLSQILLEEDLNWNRLKEG